MIKTPIFHTERMMVRRFEESDLPDFSVMQGDIKVLRYVKSPLTFKEAKQELSILIAYYDDPQKFYNLWAIEEIKDNTFLGLCGVYENKKSEKEIAYRFVPKAWGKGLGLEIAQGLINFCFNELKIERLVAHVDPRNIGSVKILNRTMRFLKEENKNSIVSRSYELLAKQA